MTTANSPLHELTAQANKLAETLKKSANLSVIRIYDVCKFSVIMDDKIVVIEMLWETIRASSEAELSDFILRQMQEQRPLEGAS
jgi:hypothetical protein